MLNDVFGAFGVSTLWLLPLLWRLLKSLVYRDPERLTAPQGAARLWLGAVAVLLSSTALEGLMVWGITRNPSSGAWLARTLAIALSSHVGLGLAMLSMLAVLLLGLPAYLGFAWRDAAVLARQNPLDWVLALLSMLRQRVSGLLQQLPGMGRGARRSGRHRGGRRVREQEDKPRRGRPGRTGRSAAAKNAAKNAVPGQPPPAVVAAGHADAARRSPPADDIQLIDQAWLTPRRDVAARPEATPASSGSRGGEAGPKLAVEPWPAPSRPVASALAPSLPAAAKGGGRPLPQIPTEVRDPDEVFRARGRAPDPIADWLQKPLPERTSLQPRHASNSRRRHGAESATTRHGAPAQPSQVGSEQLYEEALQRFQRRSQHDARQQVAQATVTAASLAPVASAGVSNPQAVPVGATQAVPASAADRRADGSGPAGSHSEAAPAPSAAMLADGALPLPAVAAPPQPVVAPLPTVTPSDTAASAAASPLVTAAVEPHPTVVAGTPAVDASIPMPAHHPVRHDDGAAGVRDMPALTIREPAIPSRQASTGPARGADSLQPDLPPSTAPNAQAGAATASGVSAAPESRWVSVAAPEELPSEAALLTAAAASSLAHDGLLPLADTPAEPELPPSPAPPAAITAEAAVDADMDTDTDTTDAGEGMAILPHADGFQPPLLPHPPIKKATAPLPPLDLLSAPPLQTQAVDEAQLAETGTLIEQRLREFKVPVSVVGAGAGPVITRFEVEPAVGVRGNQVVALMKDLARGLGRTSIRVVETIPGKTCMGLELPNEQRQMIALSEILDSAEYRESDSLLTLAMGKGITGEPVVADLAKAPHMLVAGTTGSGKSVAVNAMILSMLYKATPEQVRLIMIDPKMLELSVYEGIPHLLAPVVTDMKLAANALAWCVGEMENRYRLMSELRVRNLAGFNQKVQEARDAGRPLWNPYPAHPEVPEYLDTLPMIVVVIDELADLMMVAGKKIEELIARLAQKARAAGIHLILATQRPSVDVITGLIKANIPTRVAFQVSSKIDSRTILDQMGAESLLGQGDMLFLPPGTGYPQRVHGAFVADEEVLRVVAFLKQFGEPDYIDEILAEDVSEAPAEGAADAASAEADPLYDEAAEFVLRTRRASISFVQRQFRIGYNRAARLVEAMEAAGLVSSMGPNGQREVLAPGRDD